MNDVNDAISRQAAIDAVYKCTDIFVGDMPVMVVKADAYEALAQLPSAQPEPKRGKWERHYCKDGNPDGWQCDKCKEWYYFGQTLPNFCPNCGADMRTAEQIVHDAIDNTPMAEDAYPGIKERLHKAVDDMREVTNGN